MKLKWNRNEQLGKWRRKVGINQGKKEILHWKWQWKSLMIKKINNRIFPIFSFLQIRRNESKWKRKIVNILEGFTKRKRKGIKEMWGSLEFSKKKEKFCRAIIFLKINYFQKMSEFEREGKLNSRIKKDNGKGKYSEKDVKLLEVVAYLALPQLEGKCQDV